MGCWKPGFDAPALDQLRAFRSIPDHEVAAFLLDFASAVEARLSADPAFERSPVPACAFPG